MRAVRSELLLIILLLVCCGLTCFTSAMDISALGPHAAVAVEDRFEQSAIVATPQSHLDTSDAFLRHLHLPLNDVFKAAQVRVWRLLVVMCCTLNIKSL